MTQTALPLLVNAVPAPVLDGPEATAALIQEVGVPTPGADGPGNGGGAGGGAAPGGSPLGGLLLPLMIGAVVWFLIFAPERKNRKKREEMLGAVKKGDKVITTGGLHAQVVEVKESEVTLKAGDTRLTFSRSSIHEVVRPKDASSDGDA